jgi:hypothetical protein
VSLINWLRVSVKVFTSKPLSPRNVICEWTIATHSVIRSHNKGLPHLVPTDRLSRERWPLGLAKTPVALRSSATGSLVR